MRRTGLAIASLLLAFALTAPLAASADPRFVLTLSPEFFQDMTGDSTAPPLGPTFVPITCPGGATCPGTPRTTLDSNIDYGLTYIINKKWNLAYNHSAFDFSLGRISSIPIGGGFNASVLSGDVMDRTDQITLNYAAGHGFAFDGYWGSHQRDAIAASAEGAPCFLNSQKCYNNTSNPDSIDSRYYGVGGTYSFGPHTAYEPPLFKLALDVNYYPRPANGNCGAALAQPACGQNGIAGYVGSGATYPYGITMFPLSPFKGAPLGFIPFVGYQRLIAWFHAENSPEMYNAMAFGFVQVLPHGLSFSYTNFKLNGCLCSDTVPPPDSVRSDVNIYKLTYELKF